jgi:uncharacterized protein YjdB
VLCISEAACSSKKILLVAVLALLAALAGCGDAHLPFLTTIQVSPAVPTIDIGQTQQFTAKGTYSDGNTADLTNLVTWSSSNTTVAAISSTGLALSHSQGSSTISATFHAVDGPVTGVASLGVIVTLKSITITPVNPAIANGTSLQLTATGIFSDGTTQDLTSSVSWTSSTGAIATVSNTGLITGTSVGSTTITATQAGVSGTTIVTVTGAVLTSITVTPTNSSIAKGTSTPLTATGNFSDGSTHDLTTSVTWTSSTPLAMVSNAAGSQGVVTGADKGMATITATQGALSGNTAVSVTSAILVAIVVTPVNSSVPNGITEPFTATGAFSDGTTQDLTTQVIWSSSSPAMATVDSSGVVTGTGVGNATISAALGTVSGSAPVTITDAILTSLAITPATSTIPKGNNEPLIATGTFSDGNTKDLTTSVTWVTSDPSIAPVSNADGSQGTVTGIKTGLVNISAALPSVPGVTASATVTVTAAVLVSIAVTPANPSIADGGTISLKATGTYSDGTMPDITSQVGWTSSTANRATVDPTGLVTGTGVGAAPITATLGTVSGSTTVTVLASCSVGDNSTVAAYNAIPFNVVNCSPASQAFEGTATSELGNGVNLATGTGRTLFSLSVAFVSFACSDSGHWYSNCVTTPGTTFDVPITANIYAVDNSSSPPAPGTLLASVKQTQTIPFRPSADLTNCPVTGDTPYGWFNPNDISNSVTSPGACEFGITTVLTFTGFTLSPGVTTLPNEVIWTVAFNTTHSGFSPVGVGAPCFSTDAGCPYDSLNVGAWTFDGEPYAGTDIDPNGAFVKGNDPVAYCPGFTGKLGVLQLDTPCWMGYTPLGEIITH